MEKRSLTIVEQYSSTFTVDASRTRIENFGDIMKFAILLNRAEMKRRNAKQLSSWSPVNISYEVANLLFSEDKFPRKTMSYIISFG